jgi:DNA-binding MarR family transcriptional regulator
MLMLDTAVSKTLQLSTAVRMIVGRIKLAIGNSVARRLVLTTKTVKDMIIKSLSTSGIVSPMSEAAPGPDLPFRKAKFRLGQDGVPMRRTVAPLTRSLQQICASIIAEALAEAGLVQLEFALMVFAGDLPGISQQTLTEALGIDRNNASLLVEKLEARGLIRRSVNGDDRRARQVYLTRKGENLARQFLPEVRAANQRILAPLTAPERKLFIDMLVRLVEGNRSHKRPGAGRRKRSSGRPTAGNQRSGRDQADA